MDRLADFAYLCFGLGFFTFMIWFVTRQNDVDYERRLHERREFGLQTGTEPHSTQKDRK